MHFDSTQFSRRIPLPSVSQLSAVALLFDTGPISKIVIYIHHLHSKNMGKWDLRWEILTLFFQPFKHYISLTLMAIYCVYSTRKHPLFRHHRVWRTYVVPQKHSYALFRSHLGSQSQKHIPVNKTLTLRASQTSDYTTCSSQWIPFTTECIFTYFIVWLARTARETHPLTTLFQSFFCLFFYFQLSIEHSWRKGSVLLGDPVILAIGQMYDLPIHTPQELRKTILPRRGNCMGPWLLNLKLCWTQPSRRLFAATLNKCKFVQRGLVWYLDLVPVHKTGQQEV